MVVDAAVAVAVAHAVVVVAAVVAVAAAVAAEASTGAAVAAEEFAGVVVVEVLILDQDLRVLDEENLVASIVYGYPYRLAVVAVDVFGDVLGVVLNTGRKVVEEEPADEDVQELPDHCVGYKLQVGAYTHSH